MYVCRFFKDSSRHIALSETKVVPSCSHVDTALLRRDIIGERFLTCARHVKIEKNRFLEGVFKKMHVNFSSSIGTLSSEDRRNEKIITR